MNVMFLGGRPRARWGRGIESGAVPEERMHSQRASTDCSGVSRLTQKSIHLWALEPQSQNLPNTLLTNDPCIEVLHRISSEPSP